MSAVLLDVFIWSNFTNAVVCGGMAAFVLMSRPLNGLKLFWAATCASVSIWSLGVAVMAVAKTKGTAMTGIMTLNFASIVLPAFLMATAAELIGRRVIALSLASGTAVVLLLVNLSGMLATVRSFPPFDFYTARLPFYDAFVVYIYSCFGYVAKILFDGVKAEQDWRKRKQIKLLLVGVCISFAGGQTTIPFVYGINVFPFGVLTVPTFVLMAGYGMFKYQFLDFRFAARRLLLAIAIYAAIAVVVGPVLWPLLRSLAVGSQDLIRFWMAAAAAGAFLATGPAIYSLLTGRSFWLKDRLSIGLTHELKSPLGVIQSTVSILREKLADSTLDAGTLGEYLLMIERNAERLGNFSQDLLTIASNANDFPLSKRDENLQATLRAAVDDHAAAAHLKGPTIHHDLPPEEQHVLIDRSKMMQAIGNILNNAIRHTFAGEIVVTLKAQDGMCVVSVKDSGTGIERDDLGRIFEQFYQVQSRKGGSGLGLTIAKSWIEAHGGQIWADSDGAGKGTTVTFTLPSLNRVEGTRRTDAR